MRHLREDSIGQADVGLAKLVGQTFDFVEEPFDCSGVHQDRGQSAKIAVNRRCEGVGMVFGIDVMVEPGTCDRAGQVVQVGFARPARAAKGEVGRRADQGGGSGLGQTCRFQTQHQCEA